MPEAKKATLKTMLAAELAAVLSQRPDLKVVRLTGAKDNWTFLDALPVKGPSISGMRPNTSATRSTPRT